MDREFRNQGTCLWCGQDLCQHPSRVITTKDWALETPEIFAYVKCKNCKSLALVNPPVDSQLGLYYPTDYAPYVVKPESLGTIGFPKQILSRLISDPRSDINILDYGCGNGTWLAQAANTFEGAKLHAVDFNPSEAIGRIHWIGKDVNVISPQDFLLSQQVYDVINFGHSIEHVSNPLDVLKVASSRLSEKGVISLACPVSNSVSFAIFGAYWVHIDSPRHVSIPSISAVSNAIVKNNLIIFADNTYGSPTGFSRSLERIRRIEKNRMNSVLGLLKMHLISKYASHFATYLRKSSKYHVLAIK